jgi:hypothetical protein
MNIKRNFILLLGICLCSACSPEPSNKELVEVHAKNQPKSDEKKDNPRDWMRARSKKIKEQKAANILVKIQQIKDRQQAFVDSNYIIRDERVQWVIEPQQVNKEEQATFRLIEKAYESIKGRISVPEESKMLVKVIKKHKVVSFYKALPPGWRGSSIIAEVFFNIDTGEIKKVLGSS